MIICSCAVISDRDIERAVGWMRAADPHAVVTPGKVYRALGKRPVCGGCVDHFVARIAAGLGAADGAAEASPLPAALRNLRATPGDAGERAARSTGRDGLRAGIAAE